MKIAVAGATGVVGRHVADVAQGRGHDVVALARRAGIDLTSAAGLAERLNGTDAVIDVVSVATQSRRRAEQFFGLVTDNLLGAEKSAGVGHHVTLSIIGIDSVHTGYYQGKLRQEEVTAGGTTPWTILRASQFHEFAEQALHFLTLGRLAFVPVMTVQPVAAREVAAALVDAVEQGPQGRVPDLAGPEVHQLVDLAQRVNRQLDLGRRVVGIRVPGPAGRRMRSGDLTLDLSAGTPGPRGTQTFETWLQERSGTR